MLARAAELRGISVSDYVRQVTVAQARKEVEAATGQTIAMTPEEQLAFWTALNAPAKLTAAGEETRQAYAGRVVNAVQFPTGFRLERLVKAHPRKAFASGQADVDDWLKTKALQHQDKHLSVTKVLLDDAGAIAGYFTLATGRVDFGDLPADVAKKLPKRILPIAIS